MEEKKRNGDSSNKSENKEKEIVIDKKVDASNTIEIDTINEDENKLKDKEQKPAHTNEQKINVNPVKNKDAKKKRKIKLNKQMIGIIVIVISCIVITISLVILKIRDINSKYKIPEEENVFISENKKQDDELKYVVGENDTLDFNEIESKYVYNIDGTEIIGASYGEIYDKYQNNYSVKYGYDQIYGLKDKNVENKINEKIKSCVTSIDTKGKDDKIEVGTNIQGNFNGILSISISYYEGKEYKYKGINFDLNTGNEFKLEDVFIKSTSIINILYNSLCKALAWNAGINYYDFNNDNEYFEKLNELYNMDNRDTSYYEDMIFKLSNWYKSNKGNIDFCLTSSKLYIYNVVIDGENYTLDVPLYEYKDNVAIYKRYKSDASIFEGEDRYIEGVVPFTTPMARKGLKTNQIDYGKKTSNLFVDIAFISYDLDLEKKESVNNKIKEMMKVYANNAIIEETEKANSNKQNGYVLQSFVNIFDNTSELSTQYYNNEIGGYKIPYYEVHLENHEVELSINEFENLNEYLAKVELYPKSSIEEQVLKYYLTVDKSEFYKPMSLKKYYFDINGNYLGDDIHVIKDTTREVYNPS